VRAAALADSKARIALIGETEHEAREVMVEGVSGLLAVHKRSERPRWTSSRRRVRWKNGAVAEIFRGRSGEPARAAI
jgi:phage terminase large subunit-like protein